MALNDITGVSQLVSAEANLDRTLSRLMALVTANAGAEKAVLLLRRGNDWFVEVRRHDESVDNETLISHLYDPAKIDDEGVIVPPSVFDFCRRSQETLVVGDAQRDPRFAADRVIREHRIQSIACIPTAVEGKLSVMLYADSCQKADLFTEERVRILEQLCLQVGVSIENVLLHDSLDRKIGDLQKSEERFRSFMEQSPLAICFWAPTGKITMVNPAWNRLWGIEPESTARAIENYSVLTDPQIRDLGIMPLIERAFAGEPVVLPPIQYDGSRTAVELGEDPIDWKTPWIQCYLYPVKNVEGEVVYVVNTHMDITELKRVEREAQVQRDTLARIERATRMGQLAGAIAHELNQPLTGILSNAQAVELMVRKGQLNTDELREIMGEIVQDAKRGGEVIRNLRDLYREHKGESLPVDINDVVKESTRLLHSEFVLNDVAVANELASSVPIITGNKSQLQQVLVNLIMNGMQAVTSRGRDDRRLRIVTTCEANELKVCVEDNGVGIDPDTIDRIFEPMATWKPGGTGMGLGISTSIIEGHGGKMWAENRPEGGARVGFSIPLLKRANHP
jgi:PAS domain S-box-containing protein